MRLCTIVQTPLWKAASTVPWPSGWVVAPTSKGMSLLYKVCSFMYTNYTLGVTNNAINEISQITGKAYEDSNCSDHHHALTETYNTIVQKLVYRWHFRFVYRWHLNDASCQYQLLFTIIRVCPGTHKVTVRHGAWFWRVSLSCQRVAPAT